MGVRFVDGEELRRVLPMAAAIDALGTAFGASTLPEAPLRSHLVTGAGELLLMPSTGQMGTGVKLVTLARGNPERGLPFIHAMYVLFAPETLSPVAVLDGGALTSLRTAAVSGLATRHLAREEAATLMLFGAGVQARAHLESMVAVRPIRRVLVASRSADPARRLAERAWAAGLEAEVVLADGVSEADVVCTCTSSSDPLFDGGLLRPGTHVNAVGAYRPDMRELDSVAVARSRVVVETRAAALEEAGDLLIPIAEGAIGAEHVVAELADVVRGAQVRREPADVTVFKSVGVAFEDLVVARAAVDRLESEARR